MKNNINSSPCVHQIQHSARNIGKTHKSYCGKPSMFIDENQRDLCHKHFNRWFKKKYNQSYSEFISNSPK